MSANKGKKDLPRYVLYTKPRNEKKVAQRLSEAGCTIYCTLQKARRQWSDRVKVDEEPLFKGYAFIHIEDHKTNNETVEVFHYSNDWVCSWYDFAKAIFEIKGIFIKVIAIESAQYPTSAKRPSYSVLNKNKISFSNYSSFLERFFSEVFR